MRKRNYGYINKKKKKNVYVFDIKIAGPLIIGNYCDRNIK